MSKEFVYRWEWQFESAPEALWPLVADTDRFDQDTGMQPVIELVDTVRPRHNGRLQLMMSFLGVPIEWEQEPFEWAYPHRFAVNRRYFKGPLATLRAAAELTPRPEGGTHLVYELRVTPRNLLGRLAIPIQIGIFYGREFDRVFRQYDALARQQVRLSYDRDQLSWASRRRLESGLAQLRQQADPALVDRLGEAIATLDDITLSQMRTHMLADEWQTDRRQLLELALLATRAGVLDMRWELLCPSCRTSRQTTGELADTVGTVHCDTCQIDFETNFAQSVELVFRPNAAIRPIADDLKFCFAGPFDSSHIFVQQLLEPGEVISYGLNLEPGRYRLRTLNPRRSETITVLADPSAVLTQQPVLICDDRFELSESTLPHATSLMVENRTEQEQLFFMERTRWADDSVMAAEVIALQKFRDLFAEEALRPGDQISVGSQTFVFTDLIGSTQMYDEVGDAPAFGIVMNHFDILHEEIAKMGGAVVKTIGDAVMAVFPKPVSAVIALSEAQRRLAKGSDRRAAMPIRVGIHHGPAIAITLNKTLDYFGSTVNIASRLEALSDGRSIVMSNTVYEDTAVQDLLSAGVLAPPTERETRLKGFSGDTFKIWSMANFE